MIKWKMLYADYDQDTGISKVWIRTEIGTFSGTAYLHDEDRDIASNFEGCRYAEMRAVIKYVHTKVKTLKVKYSALLDVDNSFKATKPYVENKYTRILDNKLNNLDNQIKDLELYEEKLKQSLYYQMSNYRKTKEILNKKIEEGRKQEPESK